MHVDDRVILTYNNFDTSQIKRIYMNEHTPTDIVRSWQGHQIEQHWFSAINGSFKVQMIKIDNWNIPNIDSKKVVNAIKLCILFVPDGYAISIQALENNSKLLVMADYFKGETKDYYRFNVNYFK